MSNYKLDINGKIELCDYSSIYDYLEIVNVMDQFIITFEEGDENSELICSLLQRQNFIVKSKGGTVDGRYYISAFRESPQYYFN